MKHSEQTKLKISLALKGNKNCLGNKHTEEVKRKLSKLVTGRKYSFKPRPKAKGRKVWNKGLKMSKEFKEMAKKRQMGVKLSEETKRKMSETAKEKGFGKWMIGRSGEKSTQWKGGVTSINQIIRSSREYKLWRVSVFERDNWACIWCGLKFIKGVTGRVILHADHIKPFAYFPELRFAIDNGRTLCKPCHLKTDTWGGRYKSK